MANESGKAKNGDSSGLEAKLWAAADALRNNMDAAEYKHVVLGLIFIKYISDAFEAKHAELEAEKKKGADPEDPKSCASSSRPWRPSPWNIPAEPIRRRRLPVLEPNQSAETYLFCL